MKYIDDAQGMRIVNQLMQDIPYNVNLINADGIITASGDQSRIGELHEAGRKAAATQETVLVYEDTPLQRKGANVPIIVGDEVIGVVGVTGDPNVVSDFSQLVKSMVLVLIEQTITLQERQAAENEKRQFVNRLLTYTDGDFPLDMQQLALEKYKIDLRLPLMAVLLRKESQFLKYFVMLGIDYFTYNEALLVILNKDIYQQFKDVAGHGKEKIYVAHGDNLVKNILKVSNAQAVDALLAYESPAIVSVNDVLMFDLFLNKMEIRTDVLTRILSLEAELIASIIEYIRCNMRQNEVAQRLHIHRNTLSNRFSKIAEKTSLNPYDIYDLFILLYYLVYASKNALLAL